MADAPARTVTPTAPTAVAEAIPPVAAPRSGRLASLRSLRTFDALHDRGFRLFFVSMLAQFSSMHIQMVVNPWLVYDLTGSYARLGAIALASSVPGLILGVPGGVIADRVPRKQVVLIGQAINGVSTALVGVLLVTGQLGFVHLMIVAGLQGGVFAILGPARQAMIPEIVGQDRLTNAIALNMTGLNVTRMGVPALGGFLIAWIGPAGVYFAMAALIVLSMAWLVPVRVTPSHRSEHVPASRMVRMGIEDIRDGVAYVGRDRIVFTILMVNLFVVLMSMPYMQMLAGFVEDVLDAGPEGLGILWSVSGVGSLVGSLAVASMPNRSRGLWYLLSALVLGFALIVFSASTWFWVTAAIMVVIGIGSAGRMSLSNILLMAYTNPSYQGRVMSVYMMEFSLVSFGTFLVGIMAAIVGVQWAIGATAVSLVVIALAGLLFVPRLRRLD